MSRLGIPVGKLEIKDDTIKPCEVKAPTPVECIKYGIPIEKAKIMNINSLKLVDYMYLRKHGEFNKQKIKSLYGFPGDATYYKKLREIGAFPEPDQAEDGPAEIKEKQEFTELAEVIEATEPVVVPESIPAVVSEQTTAPVIAPSAHINPQKPSIITKHICPTCLEEYDILADAENCLNAHAWVVGINKTDGSCAFNCPPFIYVDMSDGRVMKYVAYGYEED